MTANMGKKRARAPGAPVPPDKLGAVVEAYVETCLCTGDKPFQLGEYAKLKMNSSADAKSLVTMAPLLKDLFHWAHPTGVVNSTPLKAALLAVVFKKPFVYSGGSAKDDWADFVSNALRVAMAHCRLMKNVPNRFAQRCSGLTEEERQILADVLAECKPELAMEAGDSQAMGSSDAGDSQVAEEAEPPPRTLKRVATDDLDFRFDAQLLGAKVGGKQRVETSGGRLKRTKALDVAKLLVDALSADPVDPRLKQIICQKPASAVTKNQPLPLRKNHC